MNKTLKEKIEFIGGAEVSLKEKVKIAEENLLQLLMLFAANFSTNESDDLDFSVENFNKTSQLNSVFDKFNKEYQIPILIGLTKDLFKINEFHKTYFKKIIPKATVSEINKIGHQLEFLYQKLGIKEGVLIREGWLMRVIESVEVKGELQKYIVGSLSQGKNYKEFLSGFKEFVVGNKDKIGIVTRYYNQFVFDTYSQFERIGNNFYAEKFGLNWFFYRGGLIETSREFCIKRDGRLFNRTDARKWKDDSSLPQPSTKEGYNPLVELGRFNCRHNLEWITDEKAKKELKKQKQ